MVEASQTDAAAAASGETDQVMFERIKSHVKGWEAVELADQLSYTRLSGLSNACYRVKPKDDTLAEKIEPKVLLYRKFECLIIDKQVEAIIFSSMSEQGFGPKLYFQDDKFRIESFFDGRPITIWEMRNPVLQAAYAKAIFDFNFNAHARAQIEAIKPLDKNRLELDKGIDIWGPGVKERFPSLRGKLLQDQGREHPALLEAIDAVDKHCLFKGYQEFWRSLVPRDGPIVLSHNDAQENNILASLANNEDIILIDYEYGGWNPLAIDIANYFNECACDNAHPKDVGIKYYYSNFPNAAEREYVCRLYAEHLFEKEQSDQGSFEEHWEATKAHFIRDVEKCCLLNNFFWAVWSFMMLQDKDVCDDTAFNYEFALGRAKLIKQQRKEFNL